MVRASIFGGAGRLGSRDSGGTTLTRASSVTSLSSGRGGGFFRRASSRGDLSSQGSGSGQGRQSPSNRRSTSRASGESTESGEQKVRHEYGKSKASMRKTKGPGRTRTASRTSRKTTRQSSRGVSRSGSRPDSRVSRSTSRMFEEEDSSSSEEDLENEDWDTLDVNNLPLHLRESKIRKEGAFDTEEDPSEDDNIRIDKDGRVILGGDEEEEDDEDSDLDPAPDASTDVGICFMWARCGFFSIWLIMVVGLLVVYIYRYFSNIRSDGQRILAENALVRAQVGVTGVLSPAFEMARTMALVGRAGYFNKEVEGVTPYSVLRASMAPAMLSAPAISFVALLGVIPDRQVMLKPGPLFDQNMAPEARAPDIYVEAARCEEGQDVATCFGANSSLMVTTPSCGGRFGWRKPEFLTKDELNQPLDQENYRYAHHLVGRVNLTTSGVKGGNNGLLGIDVAIDIRRLRKVAEDTRSPGGSVYVTTASGILLAGTEWTPSAQLDPADGEFIYPKLWDLKSRLPWAETLTAAMLNSQKEQEAWFGQDLVRTAPLVVGEDGLYGRSSVSKPSLRVIVYAPFKTSVSATLGYLMYAAVSIISILMLVTMILSIWGLVVLCQSRWCRKRCRRCCRCWKRCKRCCMSCCCCGRRQDYDDDQESESSSSSESDDSDKGSFRTASRNS
eukprot:TRINITY_DN4397_c0_g1_i2.p1 TRINITY_DN4397_c0_g1~~TRINITY_DN4397_c0_g1_i2.p1  ORF type:complete len:673 (-),score=80.62 TRINITY_DN4397_c0_g1_i2:73-2091(-)